MAGTLGAVTAYRKLVRDRVPEIIERTGKVPIYRRLDPDEYRNAVRAKLVEEAQEVLNADNDALLSELADLAEALDATLAAYGYMQVDLAFRRERRNIERGAFARRFFWERVDG